MKIRKLLTVGIVTGGLVATVAAASPAHADDNAERGYTFAVIGDIPYGDAQIARFPKVVDQINADPDVQFVTHLGDIKSGSSKCTDEYFSFIRSNFDRFADPLVYTPGDNEWTDCHRVNNGGYDPLERLAKIRQLFFPIAGRTLGLKTMKVTSQAKLGLPENVRFDREDVSFAAVHVVGSNNSLVNWTGQTAPTAAQLAEVATRTSGALKLIRDTFAHAREEKSKTVVLSLQADMFDGTIPPALLRPQDWSGFNTIVQTIASESAAFARPVYLFNGDSHVFTVDRPLAAGSSWVAFYGVTTPAPNLTRITVDGSTGVDNWIKVTIDEHDPAVLSWTKVPFAA